MQRKRINAANTAIEIIIKSEDDNGKERGRMNRNRKITAAVICMLFVFVTLASLFYIEKEENHLCTGEDCPVCACIHQAEQTLRTLSNGVTGTAELPIQILAGCLLVCAYITVTVFKSLVDKKVRLND